MGESKSDKKVKNNKPILMFFVYVISIGIVVGCQNKNKSMALCQKAQLAFASGDLSKALQLSEEAIKYNSENIMAFEIAAAVYSACGNFGEAIDKWYSIEDIHNADGTKVKLNINILTLKKYMTDIYFIMAIKYQETKQYEYALIYCDSILMIAPYEAKAMLMMTQMRSQKDKITLRAEMQREISRQQERITQRNRPTILNGKKAPGALGGPGVPSLGAMIIGAAAKSKDIYDFQTIITSDQYATPMQKEGFGRIFEKWDITKKEGENTQVTKEQIAGALWDIYNYYGDQSNSSVSKPFPQGFSKGLSPEQR